MNYEHKFKTLMGLVKKMRDQQNAYFSVRTNFRNGYHTVVDKKTEQDVDDFLNRHAHD